MAQIAEEIRALPKLTRTIALEITPRAQSNTKRVAGEDLPSSAFAYVGDEKKKSTWKLPIKFKDDAKTKRHIRNAIARFNQTDMPNASAKAEAWKRIVAAAKAHGIEVADEKDSKKSSEVMIQRLAEERAQRKASGADEAPEDVDEEDEEDEEDERDEPITMTFSSETPVPRWFGNEILDHSDKCVDMSRVARGMAYLVDHETGQQVGLAQNLRLEKKQLTGDVRFSRSALGQEIKQDVLDGIRPFTSLGYRVSSMVLEREEKTDAGVIRDYRCTRWMPMEGSTVAVPADTTVGVGRSAAEGGPEDFSAVQIFNSRGERIQLLPLDKIQVRSAAGDTKPQIHIEVKKMEPKHAAEIMALCTAHIPDPKRANEFAQELLKREGMTVDIASSAILAEVAKRNNANGHVGTPASEHTEAMLALNEREQKQYNLCRGIMAKVSQAENGKRENCFELEVSDQLEKRHQGKKHDGLFVPYTLGIDPSLARQAMEYLKRAGVATALTAAQTAQGKELVFTEPGPFIQFLYNAMRLKELGAQTISGLVGNVAFPKQTGRATGSWVGENPGTDVADSNLTLSQVTTSPKTYQTSSSYSRQLLAQAVIDIDNLIRGDLARDAALAVDQAGISGLGSGSNQPLGITGTSGVQAYVVDNDSGNGGVPLWSDITKMQELLEEANADQVGEPAWLTTPGIKGVFKRTPRLVYQPTGITTTVNVTGDPIWSDDDEIDGLMARWSNQVPSNLTKGTSVGTCHALILGVFSALINGLWGSGFELVVDPYRLKKQGLIELTTFILTDWANRYPVAFAVAKDCTKS